MQHGLLDSADCWVVNTPEKAIGIQLAKAGYDVFFGNNRGNKYSHTHQTLDINSKEYWEFSFPEMGKYDAPAQIEMVLSLTGLKKVTWVGHSQGTAQMFYASSADPEYWRSKLNLFVALAPAIKETNCSSKLLQNIASHQKGFHDVLNLFKVYHLLGPKESALTDEVCGIMPDLCLQMQRFIDSTDPKADDAERFAVYLGHYPAYGGVMNIFHYA